MDFQEKRNLQTLVFKCLMNIFLFNMLSLVKCTFCLLPTLISSSTGITGLNGHIFQHAPGDGEGQESLACVVTKSTWVARKGDTSE